MNAGCAQQPAQRFSEAARAYYTAHQHDYPKKRALLLQLLNLAQEIEGHVSDASIQVIAEILEVTETDILGVASFYTLLDRTPRGKHLIQVCDNITCGVLSSFKAAEYICKKLRVPLGGTTKDGNVTVRGVECLADCGRAPCLAIDEEQIGNVTREQVDELLLRFEEK